MVPIDHTAAGATGLGCLRRRRDEYHVSSLSATSHDVANLLTKSVGKSQSPSLSTPRTIVGSE